MRGRVARHADDCPRREESFGNGDRHVCLPDMHAVGADREGDVEAVIDEDRNVEFAAERLGPACDF